MRPIRFLYYKIGIIIPFSGHNKVIPQNKSARYNVIDQSHVSVKQIANIEKGQMNPSYLILRALAKVLNISLDSLINPDVSPEDEGANQMKMLYSSCPSEMRETLLHHTQETMQELTELSKKIEAN